MRSATPIVWWKSICYHYLRKTKHVTRYRNGEPVTATQVYYERVNSHTSGNIFMFDTCGVKDISKDIIDLQKYPVLKMKFSKGFVFACVQAANEFEEQRMRFFNENEVRDDYMEVREGLDFVECPFIEEMIVYTNPLLKPSWPLRMVCAWRTAHVEYQITKLFGTGYLSPSSVNYTGPLTRTSTMESRELEMAVREGLDFVECPFIEEMIVYTNPLLKPPWYYTNIAYWLASLLLLSWPLRMVCAWRTAHVEYQITKLFGTGYLSPSSVNYTGPLTRTSTMESRELEMAVRQNYLIVPSYSEAVLLEPIGNVNIGQAYIPNLPTEYRNRNHPLVTCNENTILTNYGAVEPDMPGYETTRGTRSGRFGIFGLGRGRRNLRGPTRSRSMSFFNQGSSFRSIAPISTSAVPVPRASQLATANSNFSNSKVPPRSISISGICGLSANGSIGLSSGYQSHVETPIDERRPLIEPLRPIMDEPPPPYEVALRMFTPLYNRLRQSTNSISSLLNSLSRSNSKDLRHYSLDGPSSSKDDTNS
uniref:Uncharacterized protein n=1 Tax=Acrobeloides nanus TaxID=290746 RepID=A0A914CAC1_9BILA